MRILYFAWVRQRIGMASETVDPPADVTDVAGLMAWLKGRSPGHGAAFAEPTIVKAAVNQVHVKPDHRVRPGDEIAFFPPVTGG